MNGRSKQGLYPWAAPLGYLDSGGGKPKRPCPRKAPLVRKVFDLYASGQYPYNRLLEEIDRMGLANMRGGRITLCGLGNILQNPFYIGLIFIKSSGKTYQGVHEPIISPATWQRVQDVRKGRSGPKVTRHNHLFMGLFRCGFYNSPMVPENQKGHIYYRCKISDCPTKTVREEAIETAVRVELGQLTLSAKAEEDMDQADLSSALAEVENQRESVSLRIADEERRLYHLEDLLVDDAFTTEVYDRKRKVIRIRLVTLQEQLADRAGSQRTTGPQEKTGRTEKKPCFTLRNGKSHRKADDHRKRLAEPHSLGKKARL